jgi:hypothetical protein
MPRYVRCLSEDYGRPKYPDCDGLNWTQNSAPGSDTELALDRPQRRADEIT